MPSEAGQTIFLERSLPGRLQIPGGCGMMEPSLHKEGSKLKDEHLYRRFFAMFFPLVLQNVLTLSVNLADNMMLGAYSETALSGVAAVNQIQFVYQQLLMALGDGVVMFGSQYYGQRQIEPIRRVGAAGLRLGLLTAALLFALVTAAPGGMVGLFTTDAAIRAQGAAYLAVIRFSYVFFAVTILLLALLRSVEIVGIAFRLSVMTLLVNCGINYVLIYGHFGAPEMGVVGAAIGTLTARVLECLVVCFYVLKRQKVIPARVRDLWQRDPGLSSRYGRKVVPMLILQGAWGLNVALQTAILGHMTDAAIAANSAASTLFMMAKSAAVGASAAAASIIGKSVGTGDVALVKSQAKRLQRLFVGIGLCAGAFLFFIRIPVMGVYELSEEAEGLANGFLLVLCVICVTMSYQMPTNNGIIKGAGDVNFVVKMDFISIWCIVIPVSFFMAFVVKAPPVVVVCCLNMDQVFKCVPAYIHSHKGDWIKKLT